VLIRFRLASELNVDDTAYSSASAPSWTRITVAGGQIFGGKASEMKTSGPVVPPAFRAAAGGDSIGIS